MQGEPKCTLKFNKDSYQGLYQVFWPIGKTTIAFSKQPFFIGKI